MSPENTSQFVLLLPLGAVVCTVLFSKPPNLRELCNIAIGGLLFCTVIVLANLVFDGARPELTLCRPIPGPSADAFSISFQVEPLGALFGLVASGLWILTTCYAMGYMRSHHEENQTRFFACFAVAIFAAMGAAMAKNLFTLFVFY